MISDPALFVCHIVRTLLSIYITFRLRCVDVDQVGEVEVIFLTDEDDVGHS